MNFYFNTFCVYFYIAVVYVHLELSLSSKFFTKITELWHHFVWRIDVSVLEYMDSQNSTLNMGYSFRLKHR